MLLDCRRPVPVARRPRLVAGRQVASSTAARIERADGWGIGTLETVDVVTGRVRVVLGPWKRSFTAGARYSPDGRQVVFEKVHKTGRGPDADIDGVTLSVVRLDQPGHPVRALTDPRLFAATADWSPDGERIVYSALAEPGRRGARPVLGPPQGGAADAAHVAGRQTAAYAAEPAWLPDGSGVLFSGRLDAGPGVPSC